MVLTKIKNPLVYPLLGLCPSLNYRHRQSQLCACVQRLCIHLQIHLFDDISNDLDYASRGFARGVVRYLVVYRHLGLERSVSHSPSFEHISHSTSTSRKRYVVKPRSPTANADSNIVEGVSILRPLKGLDPNMYESLETSFLPAYPKFEVIFSAADKDDPALTVVRELIAKYPHVDARIITGASLVRSYVLFPASN